MASPLSINDEHKARLCDKLEKNKFRFDWLTKEVEIDEDKKTKVTTGETIKKVDISGKVICELCNDLIYYGSKGFTAISKHLKRKKHVDKVNLKLSNYIVPSDFFSSICYYIK